ncbi:MAG: 50S ribosomal protein L24 [Candidatus Aenigmarchaeota archaeon]|nr:50S ribosomal protein L24 [Candidatus Aenigmarchaeota archaeon]
MRQEWSSNWVRSVQPRKQRKYRYNAPQHVRKAFLSVHLSKELRAKYGIRSLVARKDDSVEVMRGTSKGLRGKIARVDTKNSAVYIEGIAVKKVSGTEAMKPIKASNVRLIDLYLEDKQRAAKLNRLAVAANKAKAAATVGDKK